MKAISRYLFLVLFLIFSGCVHAAVTKSNDGFPDIWWQPVPQDQIKGWEIPPQAADRSKGEVILSKRNELGQFSNLGDGAFTLDGVHYGGVEGLWQGMKYPDGPGDERLKDPTVVWAYTRDQVFAMSGFEAKKAGDMANENMKKLGVKWITYHGEKVEYNGSGIDRHYQIILSASRAKIEQNPNLKKLLLSTGDLKFFPDHKQQPNPTPAYLYHEIYMKIRAELR